MGGTMSKKIYAAGVVLVVTLLPAVASGADSSSSPCTGTPTIVGTPGDDVLVGTAGDDVILGLGGDDVIRGMRGDDQLCGGPGEDSISGGLGADFVHGGSGADIIYGDEGSDTLKGGPDNDSIEGWGGRDSLHGGIGNDDLRGGSGDDFVGGGPGDDTVKGGRGEDILRGAAGDDLVLGDRESDWLYGGAGSDSLHGNRDSDVIRGHTGSDSLFGDGGNDTLRAGRGSDVLDGGDGDDLLVPGPGKDVCYDDPAPPGVCPAPGGNAYGGRVVVLEDQEPFTLNPVVFGGDSAGNLLINQALHAGAFSVDPTTKQVVPELLVETPTLANGGLVVNQDGSLTVHFDIRPAARWSDGTPVSGADFQFTLDTIVGLGDDANPGLSNQAYGEIIGSSFTDKTFEFTMPEASVRYELLFEVVIPKHAVEGSDLLNDWNTVVWPSAGPFVLGEWNQSNSMTLERNRRYWKKDAVTGQQLPYLDSITLAFYPFQFEEQRDVMLSRQAEVFGPNLTAILDELGPFEDAGVTVNTYGGGVWEHLNFQFGPGRLTRNPNSANESLAFRKGVAHAVDREALTSDILDGRLGPIDSIVNVGHPGLSADPWAQYDYNPATATAHFAAAKAELGLTEIDVIFTTTDSNDARVRLAELLGPMFDAAGVNYEAQLEGFTLFFGTTILDGTWDMGEFAWIAQTGRQGPIAMLDIFDPEQDPIANGFNHYRYGTADSSVNDAASARFAEIRDLVYASLDPAVIEPLILEAEQILADNVIAIPLYQRPRVLLHWADAAGNVVPNDSRQTFAWNVESWYRTDR